jgi:hypothetical protein
MRISAKNFQTEAYVESAATETTFFCKTFSLMTERLAASTMISGVYL